MVIAIRNPLRNGGRNALLYSSKETDTKKRNNHDAEAGDTLGVVLSKVTGDASSTFAPSKSIEGGVARVSGGR